MTLEQWQRIKVVFQSALELPTDQRGEFVHRECGGDALIEREVESLMRASDHAGDFIEEAAAVAVSPLLADETNATAGRLIGRYKILREIGRGGMGAVYLAERADNEYRKQVAIKLIKRGMDTDFILRRFRNERQILASLDHPNIARLLDGGTTDDGLPYFVMEYIEGEPLYTYCDHRRLTVRERLNLFCQACGAVSFAHQNLIIHRDIKPSNILVGSEGALKLLDFGIAKLLNPELTPDTVAQTATAMRLMTPEYASPEQARGEAVTPASDIYSLGVLLYELLTGHRPYRFPNRLPHDIARIVCEAEPVRPSEVVARPDSTLPLDTANRRRSTLEYVHRSRNASAESLRRELVGDLDNIILKTLSKEPQRRYATVEALCEDITRHIEGRPVSAPPYFPSLSKTTRPLTREPATGERSIAILPFKLLNPTKTEDTGDDYLGLGLADALITRLGSLRRFTVRPTSSVMRYTEGDPLAAGHQLGVGFVLDGRIRRVGERTRITVQLLDVRDGATVWAEQFDENFADVLNLEDTISSKVAEALIPQLTGGEREQLAKRGTNDPEAFEAYLRGRYHWNTFTEEGFAKAITCYYRAIALDPAYALAYTGVADYYNWLGVYGVMPSAECFAAAREAAARAIELDDTLAEAYSALGFALLGCGYQWEEAERQHQRALELNPVCVVTHAWHSLQLAMEARFEDAIAAASRAVELDPLTPFYGYNLGWCMYFARRFDESAEVQRRITDEEPNYGPSHFGCGWALVQLGRFDEAIAALRRARELMSGVTIVHAALAVAHALAGEKAEARQLLNELRSISSKRYVSPYRYALIHAALGEKDEAFACLEETFKLQDGWLVWLGVEPTFDSLRDDPRYADLLRRTGNPSSERLTGVLDRQHIGAPSPSVNSAANVANLSSTPEVRPTDNNEAYQLYVAGRYYSTRRTAEGLHQAIVRLERAVELDPLFALAYSELADCYALLNWYVEPPPPDAFEKARQAALHAIEADDNLADAHASLGLIKLHYERDWVGAEREFCRAIELKPENPVAHRWYAFTLSAMGRHEEAIAEIRRAQEISPRSAVIATAVANVLFLARRYDDAIAQCRRALEFDAGSVAAYVIQRWAYEAKGMKEEALAAFEQERTFAGETPTTHAKQAHVLAASGRHEESREVLRELLSRREEQWVTSYEIAVIYSLLGDRDSAFEWLAQAEREHAVGFTFVNVDPHMDNLRTDERFNDLLLRTNMLPPDTSHPVTSATTGSPPAPDTDNVEIHRSNQTGEHIKSATSVLDTPRELEIEASHASPLNTSQIFVRSNRMKRIWLACVAALILIAASGLGVFTLSGRRPATLMFQVGQTARLTTTGNAVNAAISPDGKYVAFTTEEAQRQSLWVRQSAVANSVRIVPPAEIEYRGLTFSHDGSFIYYVATEKGGKNNSFLYQVPTFGGTVRRVREGVDSPVALSPDGKRLAFVRRDEVGGRDILMIADEGGGDVRQLVTSAFPDHISTAHAPAWSADGERIAFVIETSDANGFNMKPVEVEISDRRASPLSSTRWLDIGQMAWMPDGGSLIMAAQEEGSSFVQLWQVSYPQGEAQKLTNDLSDYRGVSMSSDASSIVSVQRQTLTSVWVAPESEPSRLTQITTGAGRYFDLAWTPDGKILYASDASGSADIWEMEANGTGQKQLTAGAGRNYAPVPSADNNNIVFHSTRSGNWQIWRMKRDGSDPVQLTNNNEGSNWAQLTPDGQWVVYEHRVGNTPMTIWKQAMSGGDPLRLMDGVAMRPSVSPDGRWLAYWQRNDAPGALWQIAIGTLDGGQPVRVFQVPQSPTNGATNLRWTRDGRAVMYLDYRDGTTILWQQTLDDSAPKKLLESTSNVLIHSFDLASGNQFVLSRGLRINDVVSISNAAVKTAK